MGRHGPSATSRRPLVRGQCVPGARLTNEARSAGERAYGMRGSSRRGRCGRSAPAGAPRGFEQLKTGAGRCRGAVILRGWRRWVFGIRGNGYVCRTGEPFRGERGGRFGLLCTLPSLNFPRSGVRHWPFLALTLRHSPRAGLYSDFPKAHRHAKNHCPTNSILLYQRQPL